MGRNLLIIAVVTGVLAGMVRAGEPVPPETDGFVPLFNGTDWDGWYLKLRDGDQALAEKVFAIDDGVIHVYKDFPAEYELGGANATHGMAFTKKPFSRYVLRFDYKWGDGIANNFERFQYDAGVYFHVRNDKVWPDGLEYQVRYNHKTGKNHTGDLIGAGAKTVEWYSGDGLTFQAPGEGGTPQPLRKGLENALADAPAHGLDGEWNECEIIVMGDEYMIFKLNGVVVNLATRLPVDSGLIGLQAETAEIFYRNIEIEEFDESVPMEEFLDQ